MILLEFSETERFSDVIYNFGSANAQFLDNEEAASVGTTLTELDSLLAVSCVRNGVKLRLLLIPATLPL